MTSAKHTASCGYRSIDADPDERGTRCGAKKLGPVVSMRCVADSRGAHLECDEARTRGAGGRCFVFRRGCWVRLSAVRSRIK
jgi:hypothetical protein